MNNRYDIDEYISIEEAARLRKVSRSRIRNMIQNETFKTARLRQTSKGTYWEIQIGEVVSYRSKLPHRPLSEIECTCEHKGDPNMENHSSARCKAKRQWRRLKKNIQSTLTSTVI